MRATHSDRTKIRLCQRSIEILSTWQERHKDNIEWFRGGYCFVAYRESEEIVLKDLLKEQRSFGLNINWLDRRDLLAVLPDLNPDGLRGGTFSPEDGHASPLLTIHSYFVHARRLGAEFQFKENVRELILQGGAVRGIKTDQGEYGAEVVINAAGAWAKNIGRLAGLDIPVVPDCHEAAVTEPVARFLEPMIVDIRKVPGSANFYFHQHYTGQVLFCFTPEPNIWGEDTRDTSCFLPLASRRLIQIIPRLKNIRVRRTWRGLYPMTPDGFPIVGWARELKGFFLAVGMCGQGFMLGPGLAELITRVVLNKPTESDEETLQDLSPDRDFGGQEKLK
jgi:sarcosine oxidase subunit beta